MKFFYTSLAVIALHGAIILSLGGKLLYDRTHRPRVWVKTVVFDPELPVRGRYLALRLQVRAPWFQPKAQYGGGEPVTLTAGKDELVASKADRNTGLSITAWPLRARNTIQEGYVPLDQQVDFFLPEHAQLSWLSWPHRTSNEELWAEVTLPRKGPPRPIQLALKRGTEWIPLSYR